MDYGNPEGFRNLISDQGEILFYGAINGLNILFNLIVADKNKVDVLYFNYKTYINEVFKLKETSTGGEKVIKKNDSFNPPKINT